MTIETPAGDYLNHAELCALEQHEDERVRQLVAEHRQMAQQALRVTMLGIVKQHDNGQYEAGGLEQLLWQAVNGRPKTLTSEQINALTQLSQIAGGWWYNLEDTSLGFRAFEDQPIDNDDEL